jgi:hypothetical protein
MTAVTAPATPVAAPRRRLSDDLLQLIAVLVAAAVALALGLGLRTMTENQTRTYEAQGLRAQLPATWVVRQGATQLIFSAFNPANPEQRFGVSLLSGSLIGGTGVSFDRAVQNQLAARRTLLENFRVVDQKALDVGGKGGTRVRYAYVSNDAAIPQVLEGVDHFFRGKDGRVLLFSLTTPSGDFDEAYRGFEQFVRSVAEL